MAAKSVLAGLGRAALAILAMVAGGWLLAFSVATYRAHEVMAQAQSEQAWGRLEAAHDALVRAAALTPGDARTHAALGAVNGSIARFRSSPDAEGRTIAAFRRAVALNPIDSDLHAALAAAYMQFGRTEEAAGAYLRALDLDPHSALLLGSLAAVRELQGRYEDAAELYREALAIRPNEALASRLENIESR